MVKEIEYINIRELLSRVLRHKLLQEFTLERAIQETIDFMGLFGFPDLYEDKECEVDICNYRGQLPCGIIEIDMVKDCKTDMPLRSMTAAFAWTRKITRKSPLRSAPFWTIRSGVPSPRRSESWLLPAASQ